MTGEGHAKHNLPKHIVLQLAHFQSKIQVVKEQTFVKTVTWARGYTCGNLEDSVLDGKGGVGNSFLPSDALAAATAPTFQPESGGAGTGERTLFPFGVATWKSIRPSHSFPLDQNLLSGPHLAQGKRGKPGPLCSKTIHLVPGLDQKMRPYGLPPSELNSASGHLWKTPLSLRFPGAAQERFGEPQGTAVSRRETELETFKLVAKEEPPPGVEGELWRLRLLGQKVRLAWSEGSGCHRPGLLSPPWAQARP
ncbi:PREDICTED: uncharacterized protein LOC102246391 [Myotis brandtii]|uniref:uncharacterized protein LOC102246391 n=1 Tax=Myotis brandtii TaxID=109478 RepID=UPI000703C3A1|nr:PREDICTED: uncharacterized protein LOC102246391 [Myotis brandtii]